MRPGHACCTLILTLGIGACDDCSCPARSGDSDGGAAVNCDSAPTSCVEIGDDADQQFYGCCFGDSVYWCDDGTLKTIDCGADNYACAYNATGGYMDCQH